MNYRRAIIPGGVFFFTVVTYNRRNLLAGAEQVDLLREAFRYTMQHHPFQIDACVVLPDHLHAIWSLPEGDHDFSLRWRLIKSYFSHRLPEKPAITSASRATKHEQSVWQRRFWEHLIRDADDYERHLNYLHYNPVKHGLASSPMFWQYSSFRHWVDKGFYPADWGSSEMEFQIAVENE